MKDGEEVEFAGTRFRVEVVSPTYTRLHPVSDPYWMLRHCELVTPREKNDVVE